MLCGQRTVADAQMGMAAARISTAAGRSRHRSPTRRAMPSSSSSSVVKTSTRPAINTRNSKAAKPRLNRANSRANTLSTRDVQETGAHSWHVHCIVKAES